MRDDFSISSRKRYFCFFSSSICLRKSRFFTRVMYLMILPREIILFIEGIYEGENIYRWLYSFLDTKTNCWIFSHHEFFSYLTLYVFCNFCKSFWKSFSSLIGSEVYICIASIWWKINFYDRDNSKSMVKTLSPECNMPTCYFSNGFFQAFLFDGHRYQYIENKTCYKSYHSSSLKRRSFLRGARKVKSSPKRVKDSLYAWSHWRVNQYFSRASLLSRSLP